MKKRIIKKDGVTYTVIGPVDGWIYWVRRGRQKLWRKFTLSGDTFIVETGQGGMRYMTPWLEDAAEYAAAFSATKAKEVE